MVESTQNETKAFKALAKLNMTEMPGFSRVSLRMRDGNLMVMDGPNVWKCSETSYVCFGELRTDDPNARMAAEAKKFSDMQAEARKEAQFKQMQQTAAAMAAAGETAKATGGAAAADEAPESEEGITADHIKMVIEHAGCTRNEAIRALRASNDDMIQAVMKLTT